MTIMNYDVVIIGGGPAGLACALSIKKQGIDSILILERDNKLGGILNQCIHNGFGLHYFHEELTGPEFANRFIKKIKETEIEILLDTMVLSFDSNHNVYVVNSNGYQKLESKAIILAMGCRERARGAIATAGSRASGVFTAGTAQRYMNIDGYNVGRRVVILGSGDIGLIMARRMTLEGAKVLACIEINPYSAGLSRNIKQCLEDFDIPLYLSHTVTDIKGKGRIEQVVVSKVDEHYKPIEGSEITFDCDTLLLSIGLIPENELSKKAGVAIDPRTKGPIVYENMETSIEGVFTCGNVCQVHDLADNVVIEAENAAKAACQYIKDKPKYEREIKVSTDKNISYTVPQHIHLPLQEKVVYLSFRSKRNIGKCVLEIVDDKENIIGSFNKEFLIPAEMQKVAVLSSKLNDVENEIIVRVKEDIA